MEDAEAFVREYASYIGATEQDALMEIERRMRSAGVRETGIASDLFSGFFGKGYGWPAGHDPEYWNSDTAKLGREAFAHFFGATAF